MHVNEISMEVYQINCNRSNCSISIEKCNYIRHTYVTCWFL